MEKELNTGPGPIEARGIPAPPQGPGIPETRESIRENLGTKKNVDEQLEILYHEAKVYNAECPWIPGDVVRQLDDGPYIMPPPSQVCVVLKVIDPWVITNAGNPVHEPFDMMVLTLVRDEPKILIVHSRYFYQEELVVEVE